MTNRPSASCSYEGSSSVNTQTLLVTTDDRQAISLYCINGVEPRSSSGAISRGNGSRLLGRWFGGRCATDNILAVTVTCIPSLTCCTIFVFYTTPESMHCRRLLFDSDALVTMLHAPETFTMIDNGNGLPVKNVRSMAYMRLTQRIFFVSDDDLLVSMPLSSIANSSDSMQKSSSNTDSSTCLSSGNGVNHSDCDIYSSDTDTKIREIECYKLPSLTISNKSCKSLRSEDTVIRDIYTVENESNADIVILTESKKTNRR